MELNVLEYLGRLVLIPPKNNNKKKKNNSIRFYLWSVSDNLPPETPWTKICCKQETFCLIIVQEI